MYFTFIILTFSEDSRQSPWQRHRNRWSSKVTDSHWRKVEMRASVAFCILSATAYFTLWPRSVSLLTVKKYTDNLRINVSTLVGVHVRRRDMASLSSYFQRQPSLHFDQGQYYAFSIEWYCVLLLKTLIFNYADLSQNRCYFKNNTF